MKVVILAGGFGTRLGEYTQDIPKPMVTIGNEPIIMHIMRIYASYGFKDFVLALGYKGDVIRDYFVNYRTLQSNVSVNLKSGDFNFFDDGLLDWNVTLVDTGLNTQTGGRLRKLEPFIGADPFMITYGDGLANIDLQNLKIFHQSHGKILTISAVRPTARFGELVIKGSKVERFEEKPQLHQGWVNGGFMVANHELLEVIGSDDVMLEREPMERLFKDNELMAFKHDGFWQCMDNKRDRDLLEELFVKGAPWKSEAGNG